MLKKIVILGPESTGKSTLAQGLASFFDCPWVPEYARQYIENLNRPYGYEDLLEIARGQIALEDKQSEKASDLLICDTDLHVIKIWSEHRFGKVDPWIVSQLIKRKYTFYFLTDIDIPWQDDPQREHPDPAMRKYFRNLYERELVVKVLPFAIISGTYEQRLSKAAALIQENIKRC